MHRLETPADVAAATDDPIVNWGAQALLPGHPTPGGFAVASDDAVAVYAPALYRRDRLLVDGSVDGVLKLAAALPVAAIATTGADLARQLVEADERVEFYASFGWMSLERGPGRVEASGYGGARWLREDELDAAAALLDEVNPDAWIVPREPGVRRWAGIVEDGELVALAGDAWVAPRTGFVAGVVTRPDRRGRGLSAAVCGFVRDELVAETGGCGLMVYEDNETAIRLYERLGFTYRAVAAFRLPSA